MLPANCGLGSATVPTSLRCHQSEGFDDDRKRWFVEILGIPDEPSSFLLPLLILRFLVGFLVDICHLAVEPNARYQDL